jgi:RNA-directed DNA polymerase
MFEDIEAYGTERWLDELTQELKSRTYRPLPVRRVYIPKPGGQQRPLGVPAICDRAVMMAAVLVIDPIFEADLQPEQYTYGRDRKSFWVGLLTFGEVWHNNPHAHPQSARHGMVWYVR